MSAPVAVSNKSAFQAAVFRALQASITNNQMVEFARYAQLATINAQGIPTVRTINIRKLSEDPHTKQGVLLFSTDARSSKIDDFAHMMSHETSANANPNAHSPLVELCWFFPVTREQYRLRCRVALVYSSSDAFTNSCNNLAAPSTLPTPNPAPETPTVTTSSLRAAALTPIVLNVSPSISAEERTARETAHKAFWADHAENSRALFEIARPGTVKKRVERHEQSDLDRYEPQELSAERPSANFVSVHLIPIRCDYLKLPRPEEDTRGKIQKVKHSHESQLQPTRQQSRWLHTLDDNTGEWKAVELNP